MIEQESNYWSRSVQVLTIPATATTASATAILPSSPDDNLRTCVENPSRYELIWAGTSNQSTPTTQREEEEEEEEEEEDDDKVDNNFFFKKNLDKKCFIFL